MKEVFDSPVNTAQGIKMQVNTSIFAAQEGVNKGKDTSSKADIGEGKAWQKLMNLLLQLRKVCDQYISFQSSSNPSPYMIPNSEPEPFEAGDHLILGSGKLVLLDKLLPKLFNESHRVLLFSGFTSYILVNLAG